MTQTRRLLANLAAAVAVAGTLAGCGTGFDAQTNQVYDAAAGVSERGAGVWVLNALVVDNGDGTGTLSAALLSKIGADQLVQVDATAESGDELGVQFPAPLDLAENELVQPGNDAAIVFVGEALSPGRLVTVTLTFAAARIVEIQVPVVVRDEMYDNVATPAPPPTP